MKKGAEFDIICWRSPCIKGEKSIPFKPSVLSGKTPQLVGGKFKRNANQIILKTTAGSFKLDFSLVENFFKV
jgi:hypothetical protein